MRAIVNPVQFTQDLADSYRSYLHASFPLRNPALRQAFDAALRQRSWLVKGPLLEGSAPFTAGGSIQDLVASSVLHPGFEALCTSGGGLAYTRPLYAHQEASVRAVCGATPSNLVVATGTGSGKTESFLIPILDHLLREQAAGSLGPGVRAMLLYPMNALANDQLKRLRELLKGYPSITFGRFTGETPEDNRKARAAYRELHGEDPLGNEVIDRQTLREAPPHLLLTNYSMLEFLLLRPADSSLFDGPTGTHWRFIVLDEAHSYGGALGIELAMLLRRVKERVRKSDGRLICMGTSATLGGDDAEITRFASGLFGEPAETWQVIRGTRRSANIEGVEAYRPDASMYRAVRDALTFGTTPWHARVEAALQAAQAANVPPKVLDRARIAFALDTTGPAQTFDEWGDPVVPVAPSLDDQKVRVGRFLFALLQGDERLLELRRQLEKRPRWLFDVVPALFEGEEGIEHIHALVELAAQARTETADMPLLPARYHLFARALEGLFLAPSSYPGIAVAGAPELEASLERRESVAMGERSWPIYETCTCGRCGQLHFQAEVVEGTKEDRQAKLRPTGPAQPGMSRRNQALFILDTPDVEEDFQVEEDEPTEADDEPDAAEIHLCTSCGAFSPRRVDPPRCGCEAATVIATYKELRTGKSAQGSCLNCRAVNELRTFLTSQDAPVAVLSTTLYHHLPADALASEQHSPGDGRKLLVFSDSRQSAAYFAPFFGNSYETLLRRRLCLKALDELAINAASGVQLEDLATALVPLLRGMAHFQPGTSEGEQRQEAARLVLEEFLDPDTHNSLLGQGLLRYTLRFPNQAEITARLERDNTPLARLIPDPGERETVWQLLADSFRRDRAIAWEAMYAGHVGGRVACYFDERDVTGRQQRSWIPKTERVTNRRVRTLETGLGLSRAEALEVLKLYWDLFRNRSGLKWVADGLQIPAKQHWLVERRETTFECQVCRQRATRVLRGRCPSWRCNGTVEEVPSGATDAHYARLALEMPLVGARAKEHTAQLESKEAAQVQEAFIRGEINILSCSTTFEVGVDVGELQAVVMRNVPPETSNYLQRAGRAGRRADSVALVLTYAQRRSHDLYHYQRPEDLVAGTIPVPAITLANRKILRRHLAAVVLAAFFRQHESMFRQVQTFFLAQNPLELLRPWLAQNMDTLQRRLAAIFPEDVHAMLGITAGHEWAHHLTREPNEADDLAVSDVSGLVRAWHEVTSTVEEMEEIRARARAADDDRWAARLQEEIKQVRETALINFLGGRGVIPKYGFPVDIVPLKLLQYSAETKKLDLTRDLKIAISEYAPGSEVVAAGLIWKSTGLATMAKGKTWPTRQFSACGCGWYRTTKVEQDECPKCRARLMLKATFVIPERGFVTSRDDRPKKVSGRRPERTWATRVFFGGYGTDVPPEPLRFNNGPHFITTRGPAEGKLVVVNPGRQGQGFRLCRTCGASQPSSGKKGRASKHKSPWGVPCTGDVDYGIYLGNEFLTDVMELQFGGVPPMDGPEALGFNNSLLYALLEGMSRALSIKREDLDGCLFQGDSGTALVVYDTVPGGAGHVKRLAEQDGTVLAKVLQEAWNLVEGCSCQLDSSCYACLRNYRNQDLHEQLRRRPVREYLAAAVPALFGKTPVVSVASGRAWLAAALRDAQSSVIVAEAFEPFMPDDSASRLTGYDWFAPLLQALQRRNRVTMVLGTVPEKHRNLETMVWIDQMRVLLQQGLDLCVFKRGATAPAWMLYHDLDVAEQARVARPQDGSRVRLGPGELPRMWEIANADALSAASQDLAVLLNTATETVNLDHPLLAAGAKSKIEYIREDERLKPAQVFAPYLNEAWRTGHILDPWLRNEFQLHTLFEVLKVLARVAERGATLHITTRKADPARDGSTWPIRVQRDTFEKLKKDFSERIKLEFEIIDQQTHRDEYHRLHDRELVVRRASGKKLTMLLGRGLDFFYWDKGFVSCHTRETKFSVFEED